MTLLAFLLTALSVRGVAAQAAARPYRSSGNITPVYGQTPSREFTRGPADTVRPYLAFPETGLDDPAAYEGYETRVYRDASGNAFQIYLNRSKGRVVHLWADALNESAGFTARDSAGAPAELAWSSAAAVVGASGHTRSVAYGLEAPSSVTLGLLLLGSMRVERDFQYARRDSLPLDATPFLAAELSQLIDHIAKLPGTERARHLALLGVKTIGGLRARLMPRITEQHGDTAGSCGSNR